jgi:hypothetical protein
MRAPWELHQEQWFDNKRTVVEIEGLLAEKKEEIRVLEYARDEAIKKADAKPTTVGAIKNHLNQIAKKGLDLLNENNEAAMAWLAKVHDDVKKAVYPMRSYLFTQEFATGDLRKYAQMLMHDSLNLKGDEVNTDFKLADSATKINSQRKMTTLPGIWFHAPPRMTRSVPFMGPR